jgi:hypothetical protein
METRITLSLIKAVSGEFDLENVFKLSLTRMSAFPASPGHSCKRASRPMCC